MKKYKIAFIGGNIKSAIGMTHKIASQMDGKFELVAGAFSRNHNTNVETAKNYGIDSSHLYGNYLEMLTQEKNNIDVIAVLVSTDMHEKIVIDCLEAGYNVICEKSLAVSYKSGCRIVEAARINKRFLAVTYNYTGYPMIRVLKEKISKGLFGEITSIIIEMPQEGYIRFNADGKKPTPQSWRLKDYEIPTISLDLGSHLHNLIAFLINEKPVSLVSTENSYGFFKGLIDDVNCIVKYSNNIDVQMWYSKSALGNRNGLMIRIFGTKASAQWYQMEPEILKINKNDGTCCIFDRSNDLLVGLDSRYNRFKAGHPIGFIEAFANYYCDLYDCLQHFEKTGEYESKYILPVEKTIEGLKMFELAHKSAQNYTWMTFEKERRK